jgi:hypothetical protein
VRDGQVVDRRDRPTAAEQQRHHPQPAARALACGRDREGPQSQAERVGQRGEEEPAMVAGHADAVREFRLVRPLIAQLIQRHRPPGIDLVLGAASPRAKSR